MPHTIPHRREAVCHGSREGASLSFSGRTNFLSGLAVLKCLSLALTIHLTVLQPEVFSQYELIVRVYLHPGFCWFVFDFRGCRSPHSSTFMVTLCSLYALLQSNLGHLGGHQPYWIMGYKVKFTVVTSAKMLSSNKVTFGENGAYMNLGAPKATLN